MNFIKRNEGGVWKFSHDSELILWVWRLNGGWVTPDPPTISKFSFFLCSLWIYEFSLPYNMFLTQSHFTIKDQRGSGSQNRVWWFIGFQKVVRSLTMNFQSCLIGFTNIEIQLLYGSHISRQREWPKFPGGGICQNLSARGGVFWFFGLGGVYTPLWKNRKFGF